MLQVSIDTCVVDVARTRGSVFTDLAVLDALHSAHGGKATDERAALPLHTVGLHLGSNS